MNDSGLGFRVGNSMLFFHPVSQLCDIVNVTQVEWGPLLGQS